MISWTEDGQAKNARWHSEAGLAPPARVVVANDEMDTGAALRLASEGTAILWHGDFQNARQLLSAMTRRIDGRATRGHDPRAPIDSTAFHRHRVRQAQRARTLGMLLLPFDSGFRIPLKRAPDVAQACAEAWGGRGLERVAHVGSLRELLGAIGAFEWRKKGVEVRALDARIHPHYGVFAPIRSEYVDLVASAPLPEPVPDMAFDIGTGTGVLAAVLARRGVRRVVATENDPQALASARENIQRLGLASVISLQPVDLYPEGKAGLIVCNPPWLPGRASSALERAVYDQDEAMLRGFLGGLARHLTPGGEGWLVLSDLAERLGLRTREQLLTLFADAGLLVKGQHETRPDHPRVFDQKDPLYAARSKEVTSLWRLAANEDSPRQ